MGQGDLTGQSEEEEGAVESQEILRPQSPFFDLKYQKKPLWSRIFPKRAELAEYMTSHVLKKHSSHGEDNASVFDHGIDMASVIRKSWLWGVAVDYSFATERMVVILNHRVVVGSDYKGRLCTCVRVVGQWDKGKWYLITAFPCHPSQFRAVCHVG